MPTLADIYEDQAEECLCADAKADDPQRRALMLKLAHAWRADAEALKPIQLSELAELLINASAVVSVDTGLSHLAAALDVPNVCLFGPTNPALTRPYGKHQISLAAQFPCAPCLQRQCTHPDRHQALTPPCLATLSPDKVWGELTKIPSFPVKE